MGRVLEGIKNILSGEDISVEIKPTAKGHTTSHYALKDLVGSYKCKYTRGEFAISMEDNELYVDRLWAQEYKGKRFRLQYIEETDEKITLVCEVCDGKFVFARNSDNIFSEALYKYDTFSLPYNKVG